METEPSDRAAGAAGLRGMAHYSMSAGRHRPRRRFGQHFLTRPEIARSIVRLLDLEPGTPVLEIGPGEGVLTDALLEAGARVTAVELDRDLIPRLEARFGGQVRVVPGDILTLGLDALPGPGGAPPDRWVVAGNLPYNISKPVAMKLIEEAPRVHRAALMFQKEVALRLAASPGGRDYGPLTVLAGAVYAIEAPLTLRPGAFRPPPRVDSAVTLWRRRDNTPEPAFLGRLKAVLRAAFAARRKTVLANLRAALPGGEAEARALLVAAGVSPDLRAEALPPDAFHRLARYWPRTPERTRPAASEENGLL